MWSRATAMTTGSKPRAKPCSVRPASRHQDGAGVAASSAPSAVSPRVPVMTMRRRGPSPSLLTSGALTTPAMRQIVNDHCAVLTETW